MSKEGRIDFEADFGFFDDCSAGFSVFSDGSSNGIKKDWNFLVGDTGVVCGKIQELIDVGFNRYTIYFFNRKDNRFEQDEVILIKQMEVFKDNVIPGLKF